MNLSHGTQHRVDFMRGGRECLGMFIAHCCLLIYYIAVVMDGAEDNNLCAVHIVHLCIVLMMEKNSCICALQYCCPVTYYMAVVTAPGIMQLL